MGGAHPVREPKRICQDDLVRMPELARRSPESTPGKTVPVAAPPAPASDPIAAVARPSCPPIFHLESNPTDRLLLMAGRQLPALAFAVAVRAGVWVAVCALTKPRRHSRSYLQAILDRPPLLREVWRHFLTIVEMHLLRLRVTAGEAHHCRPLAGCEAFTALMDSGRPALRGSFHVGTSDLLGFRLGQSRRKIHMIRFRLGDPEGLNGLAGQSGAGVTFIWVNEPEDLPFALKRAVESGGTIAMKCDRVGYSARLEAFSFSGRDVGFRSRSTTLAFSSANR